MKQQEELVYFEDSDSSQNIHYYFHQLLEKEKHCGEMMYSDYRSQTTMDNLKQAVNQWTFLSLSMEEQNTLKKLVNKEANGLKNIKESIFKARFYAFFALMDYLCRQHKKWPHYSHFEYDNINYRYRTAYYMVVKGEFGAEFNSIQRMFQSTSYEKNPVLFYYTCRHREDRDFPELDFTEDMFSIMDNIRENYIYHDNAIEKDEFIDLFETYEKFSETVISGDLHPT